MDDSRLKPDVDPTQGQHRDRAAATRGPVTVVVNPDRVARVLLVVLAALVVLDFAASAAAAHGAPPTATHFFNGNDKVNFPTGFKTTMLLSLTLLLAVHALAARRAREPFLRAWWLLTFVAAFAFIDETVYLHQTLSTVLHSHLHTHGPLTFAWTIVYLPAVIAVVVIVISYMRYLSPALRLRLLIGGALYGVGSVAFEPVKSHFADHDGQNAMSFQLIAAVSDCLEMVGLTVLVIVLLNELCARTDAVTLALPERPAAGGS